MGSSRAVVWLPTPGHFLVPAVKLGTQWGSVSSISSCRTHRGKLGVQHSGNSLGSYYGPPMAWGLVEPFKDLF